VIRAVIEVAFADSTHGLNNEPHIVEALRQAGALCISLVVEEQERVVGHVAVSAVVVSDGAQGWFGLGPIAVLPEHQRKGIGATLMREALGTLKQNGAQGCVLVGEPEYYGRFGFNSIPDLIYPGVPPKYFQALTFCESFPIGSVSYHEAFSSES
jgi:putative acetyltransferase